MSTFRVAASMENAASCIGARGGRRGGGVGGRNSANEPNSMDDNNGVT